jgi:hypothetical protein
VGAQEYGAFLKFMCAEEIQRKKWSSVVNQVPQTKKPSSGALGEKEEKRPPLATAFVEYEEYREARQAD